MEKLVKTITIKEATEIAKHDNFMDYLLRLFPNHAGINLCSVKDLTFKCTNDEYGQLTDLSISFTPGTDYESIKANGGPFPWLKVSEDRSSVEYVNQNTKTNSTGMSEEEEKMMRLDW